MARELLREFSAQQNASDIVRAVVNRAFGFDREGYIRTAEVLALRTYDVADPRWTAAMSAITESIGSGGTAQYLRVYQRQENGVYDLVPLDLAAVLGRAA